MSFNRLAGGRDRVLFVDADPVRGMPAVRASVDLLADALLSHLSYEEQQLVEPMARFGPALYG
ncbi:MAG TPA: hypothetical protein VH589_30975 [Trebonia sp.]|jgi:hypothetical protein